MTNEKSKLDRPVEPEEKQKARYEKPSLQVLGKLTNLTMGSQPGAGESGQGSRQFYPQQ